MPFSYPITNEMLDKMRQTGDPPADEAVQAIVEEEGIEEARKLFDLLIGRIEMPDPW